jgi:hypothetical protein
MRHHFPEPLKLQKCEQYQLALLWTVGLSIGMPRTSYFTKMVLNNTMIWREKDNAVSKGNRLYKKNKGYWEFCPKYTKNSSYNNRSIFKAFPIPCSLNQYINFYIDHVRPCLADSNHPNDDFWIDYDTGKSFTTNKICTLVKALTNQVTSSKYTIQILRKSLNTLAYNKGDLRAWSESHQQWFHYLMDHSAKTAEEHYLVLDDEEMVQQFGLSTHPFLQQLLAL